MERRIECTDDDGEAVHRLEETGEIGTLHGKELRERLLAVLFVAGQNHLLHKRQAIFGEEHVFGAAEADTFGAECAGDLGVARDVGVGANSEVAAEFVGPAHELTD